MGMTAGESREMNFKLTFSIMKRSGTAMTEMVLALPLLLLILVLVVYFGRAMVRVQRALVMDRYEAWRVAEYGQGPSANDAAGNAMINQMFFAGNAESIEYHRGDNFSGDALAQLIGAAADYSNDAGTYAQALLLSLPAGHTSEFVTTHENTVPILRRFEGPIRHRHTRLDHNWRLVNGWRDVEGNDWRDFDSSIEPWWNWSPADRSNWGDWRIWPSQSTWRPSLPYASNHDTLNEMFYISLDEELNLLTAHGSLFADMLRTTYLELLPYRGPGAIFE